MSVLGYGQMFFIPSSSSSTGFTYITGTSAIPVAINTNPVTTGAINTTGANLLIIGYSTYEANPVGIVSDSFGNVYTLAKRQGGSGANTRIEIYYNIGGTVGAGHRFIGTASTAALLYPTIYAAAFSCATVSLVGSVGAYSISYPASSGTLTTATNDLIITDINGWAATTLPATVSPGYQMIGSHIYLPNRNLAGGMAFFITSASSATPSWANSSLGSMASVNFRA